MVENSLPANPWMEYVSILDGYYAKYQIKQLKQCNEIMFRPKWCSSCQLLTDYNWCDIPILMWYLTQHAQYFNNKLCK